MLLDVGASEYFVSLSADRHGGDKTSEMETTLNRGLDEEWIEGRDICCVTEEKKEGGERIAKCWRRWVASPFRKEQLQA